MKIKPIAAHLLLVGLALTLTACGDEGLPPTPTKTPKPLVQPTEIATLPAVATAIPTYTPSPVPPTAESVQPTEVVPTATTESEPKTVEGLIGPDSYEAGINPLTGQLVNDPVVLERRPIAVKISNAPANYVRPQASLDKADLVFEHYAEGGFTRLTAVFYSQGASQVGSVRSGRMLDLEIPAMYQAAFAYSGSSIGVRQKIRASDFYDRVISPDFGYGEPYFYRILQEGVPIEHTMFVDLYDVWAWLDNNDNNIRPELKGLAFSEAAPVGGAPAQNLFIGYVAGESQVKWVYEPNSGRYLRWQGGVAHTELLGGSQLSAANVVVVGAHHVDTDILEDHVAGGHYSIEIQVWGEGPATLFRDGNRYEGRWTRTDRDDMLTFTDLDGNTLAFKPGNTWFQMVPLGFDNLIVEP